MSLGISHTPHHVSDRRLLVVRIALILKMLFNIIFFGLNNTHTHTHTHTHAHHGGSFSEGVFFNQKIISLNRSVKVTAKLEGGCNKSLKNFPYALLAALLQL